MGRHAAVNKTGPGGLATRALFAPATSCRAMFGDGTSSDERGDPKSRGQLLAAARSEPAFQDERWGVLVEPGHWPRGQLSCCMFGKIAATRVPCHRVLSGPPYIEIPTGRYRGRGTDAAKARSVLRRITTAARKKILQCTVRSRVCSSVWTPGVQPLVASCVSRMGKRGQCQPMSDGVPLGHVACSDITVPRPSRS